MEKCLPAEFKAAYKKTNKETKKKNSQIWTKEQQKLPWQTKSEASVNTATHCLHLHFQTFFTTYDYDVIKTYL